MSAESFIRAVRRFVARRGLPSSIISDNGRNFISANQTLRKLMDKAETKNPDTTSYFSTSQIKWTFLPTYAPWMGGFYERLIGITKRAITKTLGLCKLNSDQWSTVLAEIEATINSRPLTYVGDDAQRHAQMPSAAMLANVRHEVLVGEGRRVVNQRLNDACSFRVRQLTATQVRNAALVTIRPQPAWRSTRMLRVTSTTNV